MTEEEILYVYAYEFVITNDSDREQELLKKIIEFFITFYELGREGYAERERIDIGESINSSRYTEEFEEEYTLHLVTIMYGLKDRIRLRADELEEVLTYDNLLSDIERQIVIQFKRIVETETSNLYQLAELYVLDVALKNNPYLRVIKTWIARPDACPICQALNGTEKLLYEPFLVNGQIVELNDGTLFEYDYTTKIVAVAHPNDRCYIDIRIIYD